MKPAQKVLTTILWALTVLIMVSVIGAGLWRRSQRQIPDLGDIQPFALVDQNEKPVTLESLKGKPFLVDVIFTRCGGVCPMMTSKMATLQKNLPAPDLQFVSITTDPEFDTPAVLKEYASRFQADESRWKFLTGTPEQVKAATRAVMLAATRDESGQIVHSEKFLLVDGGGKLRGIYESNSEPDMDRLKADATALADDAAANR